MLEDFVQQISATKGIADLITIFSSASIGYCDSQGIALKIIPRISLSAPPIILQTAIGGTIAFKKGHKYENNLSFPGIVMQGSLRGFSLGAIESVFGYGLGYGIGSLMR